MGIGGAEIHLVQLSSHNGTGGRVVYSDAYGRFIFHNVPLGTYIVRVEETDALPDATYLPRELMKSKIVDLRKGEEEDEGEGLVFGYTPNSSSPSRCTTNGTNCRNVVRSSGGDIDDDDAGLYSQQTAGIVLEKKPFHSNSSSSSKKFINNSLKTKGWKKVHIKELLLSDSDMSFNDDMVGAEFQLGDTKPMMTNVVKTITTTPTSKTAASKATVNSTRIQDNRNIVLSSNNNSNTNNLDNTVGNDGREGIGSLFSLLSGRVYKDTTTNSNSDNNNKGAEGIIVYLVDIASREATKTNTKTDTAGNYSFHNIRPSTYAVCVAERRMSLVPLYSVQCNNTSQVPPSSSSSSSSSSLSTQKIVKVCNGKDYLGVDFEYHRLNEDVYSLLFFAEDQDKVKTTVVYLFVFAVFCMQICLLAPMLIGMQYFPYERWGPLLISIPRITIPAHTSRFLVNLVIAIFQTDLITLTRDLFSGYGAVFPHQTSIRRMDNILFAIVCSVRFVIKVIGLLTFLITVIQNGNTFDLISNFLAIGFVYHLPTVAFKLLVFSSSLNRRGIVNIWKGKVMQTCEHKYLKIRSRRAIFMRYLEFMIILCIISVMQGGMFGWTTKFLENHKVQLDLNRNFLPLVSDNFSHIPITEDHNMRQDDNDSTKDDAVSTNLQLMQREHEVEIEKLKGKHFTALRLAEDNHLRVLQEKTESILADKERETDKIQFISEEKEKVKLVAIEKDKELEELELFSGKVLEQEDSSSNNEVALIQHHNKLKSKWTIFESKKEPVLFQHEIANFFATLFESPRYVADSEPKNIIAWL